MKTSISKFLLASAVIICGLAFVQGDAGTPGFSGAEPFISWNVPLTEIQEQTEIDAEKAEQNGNDEDDFAFQFPNIFDVFRSLLP